MRLSRSIPILVLAMAAAQTPPAAPKDAAPGPDQPGGVFRIPSRFPDEPAPPTGTKADEPAKAPPMLVNNGKPMQIPFACPEEDIAGFGMTCSAEDPCPVYAELSGVQPLGSKIFVSGNLHNGANTMYSLFLASDDSGKTWREAFEKVRGAGLEQIAFFDFETGWVSGGLLGAIPRDPFFLLTTDGGVNWRRRPVFSESKIAVIEQFHFDTRSGGSLLVDRVQGAENGARWERYETMTGGDTWMIRESSTKPLQLKVAKELAGNADWRLRASAQLKAHLIEKRTGTRWQTIASFLVKAGECKPHVEALPEPPPEPVAAPAGPPAPAGRKSSGPPSLRRGNP